ncbi:MAG: D-alanyl-D-alanine carboxypeptidase [Clostridia bacterium]|nr:D-alanyl-D-alanine carboxypeptidase [Clostridia bacterium]
MNLFKRIVIFALALCCFIGSLSFTAFGEFSLSGTSAQSAALLCADNGQFLYKKNADIKLPMASTTKIMTALVAIENSSPDDTVAVDRRAVGVEGSSIYLTEGEVLKMEELLFGLLLASANDAAEAIAFEIGKSIEGFAALMNNKAKELGLSNTHFDNPHGLDSENHYTTASDLAILTSEALKNDTFAKIVSTYKFTISTKNGARVLINHNKLLRTYEGSIGVKTGFTKRSGRCLVSAAKRNGLTLVAVTINAPDDWNDHRTLLDSGFSAYSMVNALDEREYKVSLPVIGGTDQTVLCLSQDKISAVLSSDISPQDLSFTLEMPNFLYAPIEKGERVGKLTVKLKGKTIGQTDITAEYSVSAVEYKTSIWQKLIDFLSGLFS